MVETVQTKHVNPFNDKVVTTLKTYSTVCPKCHRDLGSRENKRMHMETVHRTTHTAGRKKETGAR